MKKMMTIIAMSLLCAAANAVTREQQQEALNQLEIARSEINTVKGLIPGFLRSSLGKNLKNADDRIAYAQQILALTNVGSKFYCTVESSFDGQFGGRGNTELEATNNAMQACKTGSRNDGFFCKKDSVACQREQ